MKSKILVNTYNKITKSWTIPYVLSALGLIIISPLTLYLYEILFYGKFILQGGMTISKLISVMSGIGSGWKLGDYVKGSYFDINDILLQDDIWVIIYEKVDISKKTLKANENIEHAIKQCIETDLEYSSLYQFINLIFIERFNLLPTNRNNMKDINFITHLLSFKNPYYPKYINLTDCKKIMKSYLMRDLSSYIHFYYILQNYNNTRQIYVKYNKINILYALKEFYHTDIDKKYSVDDILDIVECSSQTFRTLPFKLNIYEKIQTCKLTIKSIEFRFNELYKKPISCEDILPLLTLVLIFNYDIFFSVDIELIYDNFKDSNNVDGYISTLLMSALNMFKEFTNNFKKERRLIKYS